MAELTSSQVLAQCWPKEIIHIKKISLAFTEYSQTDRQYYCTIDKQTQDLFDKLDENNILSVMEHRETASGGVNWYTLKYFRHEDESRDYCFNSNDSFRYYPNTKKLHGLSSSVSNSNVNLLVFYIDN